MSVERQCERSRLGHPDASIRFVELRSHVCDGESSGPHEAEEEIDVRLEEAQSVSRLNEVGLARSSNLVPEDQLLHLPQQPIVGALRAQPLQTILALRSECRRS